MASSKSTHEPPPLQLPIKSDEQLESKLAEEGLKVVELFSWAGPCSAVVPTFKRLRLDHNIDVLAFFLVDARKCSLLAEAKAHTDSSEPRFLFFRNGKLRTIVGGADMPAICRAVTEGVMPSFTEGEDIRNNPYAAAIAARTPQPAPQAQSSITILPPPMSAQQMLNAAAAAAVG